MSNAPNKKLGELLANHFQQLAVGRGVAAEKMPYFAKGIWAFIPRECPGLGTIGVTPKLVLLYDPECIAGWTPDEAGNGMLHEWLHIQMRHHDRFLALVASGKLQDNADDRMLENVAGDLEINDGLVEAGCPPPSPMGGPPCLPKNFGYPDGLCMEQYVDLLLKDRESGKFGTKIKVSFGHGKCGGCAGNPVPGEGEAEKAEDDAAGGEGKGTRPQIEIEMTRKSTAEAASKQQGNMPANWKLQIDLDLTPPQVRWEDKLRAAVGSALLAHSGRSDYTRARLSRRSASSVLMGGPLMPALIGYRAEVAFIADTSGSMGGEASKITVREAGGLLRAMGGAHVHFVACDAQVHVLRKVRSVGELVDCMVGGGGTDFRPAFEALDEMRPRPNIVIFATDGYGAYPENPPKNMRVIWLVVPGGRVEVPWGEKIDVTSST